MLIIERTTYKEVFPKVQHLILQHWAEIGMPGSENLKFDPDHEVYFELQNRNQHFVMVLKDDEEIVGYISMITFGHYHHKGSHFATVDCFWFHPDYRKKNIFHVIKMFKQTEYLLKNEFGVQYIQFNYSVNNDLSVLAKRLGYQPSNVTMLKRL